MKSNRNGDASPWGFHFVVKIKDNTIGVFRAVQDLGGTVAGKYAAMAADKMKENVAPGKGPGPHPHRTKHEDFGWLMRTIMARRSPDKKAAWLVGVFSDKVAAKPAGAGKTPPWKYGMFLEIGWIAKNGKRYRYPWLQPALAFTSRKPIGKVAGPTGLYIGGR